MKRFVGNERTLLVLFVLMWLVVGSGCCCRWFNSSYNPAPPVCYTQPAAPPATYYTAPAAAPVVTPTVVQSPACAPVVTQPCCPCQCTPQ
ncbi:MAG TPA: hypothetical protein VFE46_09590 [Pirellulales bacterium]|nr:hypothetical protein [Pirellulales bacterium]